MQSTLNAHLKALVKKERHASIRAFVLLLLGNTLLLATPLFFRHVQALFSIGTTPDNPLPHLLGWSGFLLTLAIGSSFFKYLMRKQFLNVSLKAERDLKETLFNTIQNRSEAFFDVYPTGDLINLLTQDMQHYRDMLHIGIFAPLNFVTLVVPALIFLGLISWPLMMVSFIPLIVVPIVMWIAMRTIYYLTQKRQKEFGKMSNFIHESYTGVRLIKSHGAIEGFLRYFEKLVDLFNKISMRLHVVECSFFPSLISIARGVTLSLAVTTGYLLYVNVDILSTSDFLAFMWIQSYLFFPILILGWALPLIQKGKASYERLYEVIHYIDPIQEVENPLPISSTSIDIKDLFFTYQNSTKPQLENINLSIPEGKKVGITGPLGAGKSTLLKLIRRSYEPSSGEILIGGEPIQNYKLQSIHQNIGLIEQNPFLFSNTVEENLRLAKTEATQEELERVLMEADLYATILSFPKQHDTMVGERGITLSGGQKKRLAIARTYLADRPLLLLDDLFSALDIETEKKIFHSLKSHIEGKTALLVTHRATILSEMDYVVYMAKGRIVEQGDPKTLLEKEGGYFRALYKLQEELL